MPRIAELPAAELMEFGQSHYAVDVYLPIDNMGHIQACCHTTVSRRCHHCGLACRYFFVNRWRAFCSRCAMAIYGARVDHWNDRLRAAARAMRSTPAEVDSPLPSPNRVATAIVDSLEHTIQNFNGTRPTPSTDAPARERAARADECAHIPNGEYELRRSDLVTTPTRLLIHTVQSGQLRGLRIIKRVVNGTWRGFAFVDASNHGEMLLWARFQDEANTEEVTAARQLMRAIQNGTVDQWMWVIPIQNVDWMRPATTARAEMLRWDARLVRRLCLRCSSNGVTTTDDRLSGRYCRAHVPQGLTAGEMAAFTFDTVTTDWTERLRLPSSRQTVPAHTTRGRTRETLLSELGTGEPL